MHIKTNKISGGKCHICPFDAGVRLLCCSILHPPLAAVRRTAPRTLHAGGYFMRRVSKRARCTVDGVGRWWGGVDIKATDWMCSLWHHPPVPESPLQYLSEKKEPLKCDLK